MLRVTNLRKAFGRAEVLRGVDISIGPGEIVGIVGASGAGKTVLARCMVGLERADGGTLTFDELDCEMEFPDPAEVDWPAIRQRVGYVSQVRALPPYRTLLELVEEGPRYVKNFPRAEARDAARELLREFGLADHMQKYPGEVSGGQLARTCLARAMAMSPNYLLCDEVTANLDPVAAAAVGETLLAARDRGVGLAIISHQLGFVRTYGARVDFLSNGTIAETGDPKTILTKPESEELTRFVALNKVAN